MHNQRPFTPPSLPPPMFILMPLIAIATALLLATAFLSSNPYPQYWANADFANYWIAAKLVLQGQTPDLFNGHNTYFAHMQAVFGVDYPWHSWSYPPHYLLLIAPFGFVDYLPAAVFFMSTTLLLFLHSLWRTAHDANSWPIVIWLLPATLCNLILMQNGFLTAALLLYGLSLRNSHPVIAGIAIGILTVKPQLGFLLPILLCFERRWLVILSAALTALAMAGTSTLLFGIESWTGYLAKTLPYQGLVMFHVEGAFPHMIPSFFGSLRSLGLTEPEAALRLHVLLAIPILALYLWSLARLRTSQARSMSTVFATFLITPYSVSYDLVALCAVAAIQFEIVTRNDELDFDNGTAIQRLPVIFLFALPALIYPMGMSGLPISPLIIAAAWVSLLVFTLSKRNAFGAHVN